MQAVYLFIYLILITITWYAIGMEKTRNSSIRMQNIHLAKALVEYNKKEESEYEAKVVKIEDFGCFVQLWPGCEGLVHISQLAHERVNKVEDVVKVGDEIIVKALGPDKKGRQNFSRKDALPKPQKKEEQK